MNATLYEQAQDKQGNKLAQSKGRDNRKWSRWRQGFVTEVPSLARSTSPFGEGVEHNAHTKPTRATLFLLTLSPMQDVVIHYAVALKAATEPLQTRLGQSPQLNWRLPTQPRSFTTMEYGFEVTSSV